MRGGGRLSIFAFVLLAGGESARASDIALGEYLSSACVTCHQKSGLVTGGVPAIVGWPTDQFVAVMNAYKNRERDNEVMRTQAASLSADDIAALAAYFGSLKPVK